MSLGSLWNATKLSDEMTALSRSWAMIWFKPDGTIIDANENFLKTLGYGLNDIVGKHHSIFCEDAILKSPDYPAFWRELATGKSQGGQFRRQTKEGKDVWIEASYNPVYHRGKVVRILKIASDITVTKIQSLDDGNRLRAIDQSQAIIEFEPDGRVSKVNENFLKAIGYRAEEVVGQHHRIFCDPAYVASKEYAAF